MRYPMRPFILAALLALSSPCLAQTRGNAVGDLVSPCAANIALFGTGLGNPPQCGPTSAATAFANLAPTPTRAGDVAYWNGTQWVTLAGNNSGTQVLQETSAGVPSWATISGVGTVTSVGIKAAGGTASSGSCTITSSGTCTLYSPGGFLNKFRNPGFDVWQRGTTVTIGTSGNYGPDGWKIFFTGSTSVTASQNGQGIAGASGHTLTITGAASNTDVKAGQRIESSIAAPLAGETVTFQVTFLQDTGSSVTPKLSTCFASATDNFSTCTADLAATSLTACATSTWCTESYTFNVSSSATQGYEIDFDCNAAFGAGIFCDMTDFDVRVTPGVATGINANPPPPELPPIALDLILDQRYYWQFTSVDNNTTMFMGLAISATAAAININYPTLMRAKPTITQNNTALYSATALFPVTSLGSQSSGFQSGQITVNASTATLSSNNAVQWGANSASGAFIAGSAEL